VLEETTDFFLHKLQADFLEPEDRISGTAARRLLLPSPGQQPYETFLPRCHNPDCGGLCSRRLACSMCKRVMYCSRD